MTKKTPGKRQSDTGSYRHFFFLLPALTTTRVHHAAKILATTMHFSMNERCTAELLMI